MRHAFLFALLVVFALWALPAFAINEGHYPQTIVDTNCTDSEDTPAAAGQTGARPQVQTTGDADGFCDHDSRIIAAPITVDTIFGPFKIGGSAAIIIWVDADVVSNDTDTWAIRTVTYRPHDNVRDPIHAIPNQSAEGDVIFIIGPAGWANLGASDDDVVGNLTEPFFIELDLVTATSWDGSISWMKF